MSNGRSPERGALVGPNLTDVLVIMQHIFDHKNTTRYLVFAGLPTAKTYNNPLEKGKPGIHNERQNTRLCFYEKILAALSLGQH